MIRKAIEKDLPAILKISRQSCEWGRQHYRRVFKDKNYQIFVDEQDSKITGFSVFAIMPTFIQSLQLRIDKDHQGKGIGRALTENMRQIALKETPHKPIHFEMAINNIAIQDFVSKYKCEVSDLKPDYYGPNKDALLVKVEDYD